MRKSSNPIITRRGLWRGRLLELSVLPSTNQWALEQIAACRHGDVIWARRQTAGRGRFGRAWFAPATACLTFSVVIDPARIAAPAANLGQAAALAVRETLAAYGIQAALKWPNDVLVKGRKIAGLLLERDAATGWIVLGIGLNVNLNRKAIAAAALGRPATAMTAGTGRIYRMPTVLRHICRALQSALDTYGRQGLPFLLPEWRKHDALAGKEIVVESGPSRMNGRYAGLDQEGRLCLVDANGKRQAVWSGDVTHLLLTRSSKARRR